MLWNVIDRQVLLRTHLHPYYRTVIKQSPLIQKAKIRQYCDEYMKYGFSFIGDEDCPKPQCVVCGEVLANGSMKPSLLLRHLQTKHMNYKNKERSFFQRLSKPHDMASYLSSTKKDHENAVEASYGISYHIAKSSKNHTIAETFNFCLCQRCRFMYARRGTCSHIGHYPSF
jgi:hypothetical protein